MFDINATVRVRAALLAGLVVCAACGGGGGSGTVVGGGGSPPPPPVAPPAPVITARAVASPTPVQEGQPFKLDASTSTEAGGAPLTYAWTQTSGPAVTIATPASAVLTLNAPEVTADTPAQFRMTATSGAVSSSLTVDITFTNIAQTPVFMNLDLAANAAFASPFGASVAMIAGSWSNAMVGTSATPDGPMTFTEFDVSGNPIAVLPTPFPRTFTQPSKLALGMPQLVGGSFTQPTVDMIEEKANRFLKFRKGTDGTYGTPYQEIAIDAPCTTEYATMLNSGPPAASIYIGQRGHGFSIYSETGSLQQHINTAQSLCALAVVGAPINSNGALFTGPTSAIRDVIAIDTVANTINHYAGSVGDPLVYSLKAQAPLELNSTGSLKFVASTPIWGVDQNGSRRATAGLAMIFTDGQYEGEHRLVLAGLDSNRVIRQVMRPWRLGIPSDVIFDDLDGDKFPEVIVIPSTSPQAMVYEANNMFLPTIPTSIAGAPSFMEIGLGATKALPRMSNTLSLEGLFIAYRDKNQVKLFYPPE